MSDVEPAAQELSPSRRGVRVSVSRSTRGEPSGLRIDLDPVGVVAGSRGLLARTITAAVLTCGLTAVLVTVVLRFDVGSDQFLSGGGIWLALALIATAWFLVAACALRTADLGRRRTTIGTLEGMLLVEQEGVFGRRRTVLPLDEIEGLAVELRFCALHQRALSHLVVHRRRGHPLELAPERPRTELEYVRDRLDEFLTEIRSRARSPRAASSAP
ncbi:MAG: hypothetical protein R3F34_05890 [Planctomycetota bacterium]